MTTGSGKSAEGTNAGRQACSGGRVTAGSRHRVWLILVTTPCSRHGFVVNVYTPAPSVHLEPAHAPWADQLTPVFRRLLLRLRHRHRMCRWTAYLGEPVLLRRMLVDPSHSVVAMATQHVLPDIRLTTLADVLSAARRNHAVNEDGFGLGPLRSSTCASLRLTSLRGSLLSPAGVRSGLRSRHTHGCAPQQPAPRRARSLLHAT